ncbi:MAG TPA: hypothetical protein PLZ05_03170 [Alphaproteobacteria bacterium]|nr:hypothetical protein [Alphaproteobacteria bacterium]
MQYKNPLSEFTYEQIVVKYNLDLEKNKNTRAYSDGNVENFLKDFNPDQVDFIGGLWRVQKDFPYEIKTIHDKKFIIGEKIDRKNLPTQELPIYNYFTASTFHANCYGLILDGFDYIIVKSGKGLAYGKDISMARSKLSGKGMEKMIKNPLTKWIVVWMFSKMK